MRYKISIKNEKMCPVANEICIGSGAPIGDIPLYADAETNPEQNTCTINLVHRSEDEKDISFEHEKITIIYGRTSGRIYHVVIKDFDSSSTINLILKTMLEKIKAPAKNKRFSNVFILGAKIIIKTIKKEQKESKSLI